MEYDLDERRMSLFSHLSELRVRLTKAVLAIFIGFMVAYSFHLELFEIIVHPVRDALAERGLYQLQALHITESIFVYIKLSAVVGIMGAIPYILYQVWSFIAPGLLEEERRYVTPIVLFSTVFFALGISFSYTVLLPFVTGFLTDLTLASSAIELQVTVDNVFSFSLLSMLLFGLVFQLPILMVFLTLLGIANHKLFLGFYRYFIVLAFILSALLTPPEPVSQILMALPMILLYGLGVLIAYLLGTRKIDEETKILEPIGMRVWMTVIGVLLIVVGGIVGGVWFLQPGPKNTDLIPTDARLAIGLNPSKTDMLPFADHVADQLGLGTETREAFKNLLAEPTLRSIVLLEVQGGETVVILPRDAVEQSPLRALYNRESVHSSGNGDTYLEGPDAPTLYAVQSDWIALGHPTAILSVDACASDVESCVSAESLVETTLVELRTGGPAWAWIPASTAMGRLSFPHGKSSNGIQTITWLLDLQDGIELYGTLHMASEAAARTYKTRVDVWREQQSTEQLNAQTSTAMEDDLRSLADAIRVLAQSAEVNLNATASVLTESQKERFNDKNRPLIEKLDGISSLAEKMVTRPEVQRPQEDATTKDWFSVVIPGAELKDWTLTTEENKATFHIQLTSAGLGSWLNHLKDSKTD